MKRYYTVDELIEILRQHSAEGRGDYTVKVEEYSVDDGDPVYCEDESRVSVEYKQVYFSGSP